MIGVICRTDEVRIAEEFFQLFKTPWESFRENRTYDVVLSTTGESPVVNSRLLLIFGSSASNDDGERGITPRSRGGETTLHYENDRIPIYGETLTFQQNSDASAVIQSDSGIAGLQFDCGESRVLRLGYDLFKETDRLLSAGQPVANAHLPTLELHIGLLRAWMTDAGITFLEIPPVPGGFRFAVCLTHDIDFMGIRRHKFDHTLAGFLYRAIVVALRRFLTGKQSFPRLFANWRAVASLPMVYLGWAKDFWLQFDTYRQIERGLSATYYFIPFRNRRGEKVNGAHPERRAAPYDITEIPELIATLKDDGCEIGVHGIDAWHSVDKGRDELRRIAAVKGEGETGVRMHWLLHNRDTMRVLEEAGYAYDSTIGYNETLGYRCGTNQVFCPSGARTLLELPMQIQDGALFFPQRLGLSEPDAWTLCEALIRDAHTFGGALTILWHDRSLGPERFWGDFYLRLVNHLKSMNVWFANAGKVVAWFRQRRRITFERVETAVGTTRIKLCFTGARVAPSFIVRVHRPNITAHPQGPQRGATSTVEDVAWSAEETFEFTSLNHSRNHLAAPIPA